MLKSIRKHNKWLMVGFGVLLMITWLVQPTMNQISRAYDSRIVAKLDGKGVSARQLSMAYKELSAVGELVPLVAQALGLSERDPVHWLLLSREAEDAGLVGGVKDGEDWDQVMVTIARQLAYEKYRELAPQVLRIPQFMQPIVDDAKPRVPQFISTIAGRQHLTGQQTLLALAKARGIVRMVEAYRTAHRVSDRSAIIKAREYLDAAKVDYVFVPAARMIDSIPAPDDAAVREHFDKYKTVKPGEGEYGIGYLLPPRVKLEWLKLDRAAIESGVALDPVEVRVKYDRGKASGTYKGDFAAERPAIESEMKTQVVDRAMQEAHVAIQMEIQKATKTLEPDGKFKKVPEDWESRRPKFETIAQAVVDAVRRTANVTIPLPSVTVKAAEWLTKDDVRQLPDVGRSVIRAGGFEIPFSDLVFWTRGLPGSEGGIIPIQAGVPLTETFLIDDMNNRYYFTVLATRQESAPDSVDEMKDRFVKDWKTVHAYEQLKGRTEELRSMVVSGGLDAVIAAFPPATPPEANKDDADPKFKPLAATKGVEVSSKVKGNSDPIMDSVHEPVLEAAAKINPTLPPEQVPADAATLSIAIPKRLGVAVVRILSPEPVTIEKFRQGEAEVVRVAQARELLGETPDLAKDPFSFANLLKRHRYTSGERDIKTVEDLKKDDAGS